MLSTRAFVSPATTVALAVGLSAMAIACTRETAPTTAGNPPTTAREPSNEQERLMFQACPEAARMKTQGARICTEIGCDGGFSLSVYPQAAWPHGNYRFVVKVDERTVTCEGALPLKPCGTASLTCDAQGVSIGESGCAIDPSQHAFSDIYFDGFPRQVSIEVHRDGVRVANARYTPKYQASQPNGAGCDPICCGASGDFTLPPG